jgi:hypothetical protein
VVALPAQQRKEMRDVPDELGFHRFSFGQGNEMRRLTIKTGRNAAGFYETKEGTIKR